MKELNISIARVFQHNYWNGKDCPQSIRRGEPITWITFLDRVKNNNAQVTTNVTNDVLYRVQVGAFKNKNNAINLSNELKNLGYDTLIIEGK